MAAAALTDLHAIAKTVLDRRNGIAIATLGQAGAITPAIETALDPVAVSGLLDLDAAARLGVGGRAGQRDRRDGRAGK